MFFLMPVVRKAALPNNTSNPSIKRKSELLELKSILVLVIPLAPCFKEATKPSKENTQAQHRHRVTPQGGKRMVLIALLC